jgi:hypothetical protein
MKKPLIFLIVLSSLYITPAGAQGGLFKKVTGAMKSELLGTGKNGNSANQDPEPSCACNDAEQIVGLGGKLQIDYNESNITTMDDGSLLLQNKMTGEYFIVKDGVVTGPLAAGDPRIAVYSDAGENVKADDYLVMRYKGYISKSGDKYLITFAGKSYGPFAQISSFVIPKSKDKFAAIVIENMPVSEAEGKKMETAINNAKTDQEKMALAMQYTQMMQQKMMQGGGPGSMTPKLITNIPDALTDFTSFMGGTLNGNAKYDDILMVAYNKISDLKGNTVINLKDEHLGVSDFFVNTTNTKYAIYNYGTIMFSDGTSLADLFNPHLVKSGNQVYITYMYYSPKKNAMMRCKIPF